MTPILITGLYDSSDPTHGQGLGDWIRQQWKQKYGQDIVTSVWDRDVMAIIPAGPVPPLIGFSWGFSKALQVARQLWVAGRTVPLLVSIDGVPKHSLIGDLPDPLPNFKGFDLPDGVLKAACIWRGYNNQHGIFSGPIRSAKCPFINQKYNPTPGQHSEAEEHGEYCRAPAAKLVVDWLRLP